MKDRLLSTLGICRKAAKLVLGFTAVSEAAAEGTIFLLLLAKDLSPKSAKRITHAVEQQRHTISICTAPFTMDEVQHWLGKRSGIIGVADQGLAHTLERTCRQATATEEE